VARFNTRGTRAAVTVRSPLLTREVDPTGNYEGGAAYSFDAKSELFRLAVTNMTGQDTFYEKAQARDDRFVALVRQVTREDVEWIKGFVRWLRREANMRSASAVAAIEAAKVMIEDGVPGSRGIISSALARADEPAEALAFYASKYGRRFPMPVKRGVADAAVALWNEYAATKWDSPARAWRMADVIEMCHPDPKAPWQSDLFRYLLDDRHGHLDAIPDSLGMLCARAELLRLPVSERRAMLAHPTALKDAGITWEALAGWLQGPMDREAWEAVIPQMGIFALLRNLRNFDNAEVSKGVAAQVIAKLTDPDVIARSRLLPMRFLSAYRNVPSLRWGQALEEALQLSLRNVPELPGRTLILVDRSSSMFSTHSDRSELTYADTAAVFGVALALRCEAADLVQYGSTSQRVEFTKGGSVLKTIEKFANLGGTETAAAVKRWYNPDVARVVILTDEQAFASWHGNPADQVPANVPVYTWNLAGYRTGHAPSGVGNRHAFAGLTDQAFRIIPLLEAGGDQGYPWEAREPVTAGARTTLPEDYMSNADGPWRVSDGEWTGGTT
jgi:hypothetical protein